MKEVVFAFILALRLVVPTSEGRAMRPANPESEANAGAARPAASGPVVQGRETAGARPLVFTHVTVIDMTGAAAKPDQTVIIIGDRITALGAGRKVKVPKDAQVIDAAGKFLIPGLWDMHVHLGINQLLLPRYVANGVTGVRSMADSVATVRSFREQIAAGKLVGPRIVATAGTIIDGPRPIWPGSITAGTEAEGREAVKKAKAQGSDFIKVYERLPRPAYFGIADEARQQGIMFVGHIPLEISAGEAADAGQKSIEHLIGIPLACSAREAELRAEALDTIKKADPSGAPVYPAIITDAKAGHSYDPRKAAALFSRFVKNRTAIVPTLTVARSFLFRDDPDLIRDPRLEYLPDNLKRFWLPSSPNPAPPRPFGPAERLETDALFQQQLDLVGAMQRAGVEILAGTDAPNFFSFPGFGMHDELKWLVRSGLTPMQALQAATRNAARFMGKLDSFGTVEAGKFADLVLLDGNPLERIENSGRIAAVVINGKLLLKDRLQELLQTGTAPQNNQD